MGKAPKDVELEDILAIAREAAAVVMGVYSTAFAVEMKGPNDPVTRADREANELICARLATRFPESAIVAEESVPTDSAEITRLVQHERVFFVDPLDGTREFADRLPEFAVMIGLAVRGRAELGVVVMPVTGEALCGRVGDEPSAFLEDAQGNRRPLRVSERTEASTASLMASRSHRPPLIAPLVERLGVARVIACGSVGVKVARVMTGEADIYVHDGLGPKHWDTCGPEAILRAAGGRFTNLDGEAMRYDTGSIRTENGMIATNNALFATVVEAVRACR